MARAKVSAETRRRRRLAALLERYYASARERGETNVQVPIFVADLLLKLLSTGTRGRPPRSRAFELFERAHFVSCIEDWRAEFAEQGNPDPLDAAFKQMSDVAFISLDTVKTYYRESKGRK